jgi:hypothetical protein
MGNRLKLCLAILAVALVTASLTLSAISYVTLRDAARAIRGGSSPSVTSVLCGGW